MSNCKSVTGILAGSLSFLVACGGGSGSDELGGEVARLASAREVMEFSRQASWRIDGNVISGQPSSDRGLLVNVAAMTRVESAKFVFDKTPNVVSLTLRNAGARAATLLSATVDCAERGVANEPVGSALVEQGAVGSSQTLRLTVPATLQARLAGGCAGLVVNLSMETEAGLTARYLLSRLELRSPTPPIGDGDEPLCGLPDTTELLANAVETPDGYWDYQTWMAERVPQAELEGLAAALAPFDESVLEAAFDHVSQRVIIATSRDALKAGKLRRALEDARIALPLRLQQACNDVAELKAAGDTLLARRWHPKASEQRFASHLDAGQGAWVVTFDADYDSRSGNAVDGKDKPQRKSAAEKVARALEKRLGTLVQVRWGKPGRYGRLDDGERHFGGAGIGAGANNNGCTSGFVVRRASSLSTIGAVTAGHCFANGTSIYSGPEFYGTAAGRAAFPQFDMERIDPSGELFTNTIHTGPSAPITRTQVGRSDPTVGSLVCISGMITGAKCGAQVTTVNTGQICDSSGCTNDLARAERPGVTINQPGDSGAPIYTPSGATGALIKGMNLGAEVCCSETLFHRVSTVESTLGVIVMTP